MKLPSIKPRNVAFILIVLCLCACKSRQKTTLLQSLNKIEATQLVESTLFHNIDFVLVDSTIERTKSDTITRVRYIRATKAESSTYEQTQTQTRTDTLYVEKTETAINPNAVVEKKKGLAWLCPSVRMVFCIFFLIFFVFILVFVKKKLLLRRS